MTRQTKRVRVEISTLLGLVFGGMVVAAGVLLGQGLYRSEPALGFILLGGLAAVWCVHGLKEGMRLFSLIGTALWRGAATARPGAEYLFTAARMVRQGGFPALAPLVDQSPEPLLRRGFQFLVDGEKVGTIRQVLEGEVAGVRLRLQRDQALLATAGWGIVLFGVGGLGLGLWSGQGGGEAILPLGWAGMAGGLLAALRCRLQWLSAAETRQQELFTEGTLALAEGDNPAIVLHRVNQYLEPAERLSRDELCQRLGG